MSPADGPRSILVTGLTSLRPYAMELENLGNFVIVEPLFRTLRDAFPSARIRTTLQLTPAFEERAGIEVLRDGRLWGRGRRATAAAMAGLAIAAAWRFASRLFRVRPGWLARLNLRLRMVAEADLVLDFSGDMLGDNAQGLPHLLLGWSTVATADLLNVPVYSVASSPGPSSRRGRAALVRDALRRCRLVSTRDPVSRDYVRTLFEKAPSDDPDHDPSRTRAPPLTTHACPSFGFRPVPDTASRAELVANEPALAGATGPVVGLIVAHLNMAEPPLYRWPRSDRELAPFVELVRFMIRELGVRVCVMSHQNKTDRDYGLVPGPDHRVVRRLVELVDAPEAFTFQGLYDASEMHRLIGGFDALVSGRVHGAVQGLSQALPTAIVEYRLPPAAHKHRGFARLVGMERFLCTPDRPAAMREAVGALWRDREAIRKELEGRVPALAAEPEELWRAVLEDWWQFAGRDARRGARGPTAPHGNSRAR